MSTYTVIVEETLAQSFSVEAGTPEDALELVRAGYRSGGYVLEPGEVQAVQIGVVGRDGQVDGWEEL